ncbi:hypothetical protein FA95DRAFT_934841 [Auriscalpium vulgare]|uniref:Uncharacterized protein n=1 Tax=Auriscalpium vulgare TaxID=40419 RepID=A0ACB8S952_9AGAM|nr:hypothetical protein FA95DRAFT_934841 [Auriscalpium vulgare]
MSAAMSTLVTPAPVPALFAGAGVGAGWGRNGFTDTEDGVGARLAAERWMSGRTLADVGGRDETAAIAAEVENTTAAVLLESTPTSFAEEVAMKGAEVGRASEAPSVAVTVTVWMTITVGSPSSPVAVTAVGSAEDAPSAGDGVTAEEAEGTAREKDALEEAVDEGGMPKNVEEAVGKDAADEGGKPATVEADAKAEDEAPNVEVASEPNVEVSPEPNVEVASEPNVEVSPEPKVEVAPEPKVEVAPDPKVEVASSGSSA